mmetsp:Transcript_33097/g.54659  ORF Transcript_33097/g.54659 Transcript_33097/m.54659 type:complete len:576 (+) Transcript_33097:96-1823(+)
MTSIALFAFALLAAAWRWKEQEQQGPSEEEASLAPEVMRLRQLLSTEELIHPFLRASDDGSTTTTTVANFCDLASACATCCGVSPSADARIAGGSESSKAIRKELVDLMGGTRRQHIILILCDGLGNNIINQHLPPQAFLRKYNQPKKLRAVFPSTTPAALTTLATAQWPGQHGVPGWDLREVMGCDYPGDPVADTVQLRVLAPKITNLRTGAPTTYPSIDDVFVAKPWARAIRQNRALRRMMYINAYNGDEFPSWYQGTTTAAGTDNQEESHENRTASVTTDFSAWQMAGSNDDPTDDVTTRTYDGRDPFEAVKIHETAQETLGEPEGSKAAIQFFADGVDASLSAIANVQELGQKSFHYIYTAHPDKHMHALGTNHPEVAAVVQGINDQVERLCHSLSNRSTFLQKYGKNNGAAGDSEDSSSAMDVSIIITADHGHITVSPDEMIQLPSNVIECLEYANIGVHGKGRHGYLHCKSGLQTALRERWRSHKELSDAFLLLTIEEAAEHGLFGPHQSPLLQVRPRLGDYVAIATTGATLVSPKEHEAHTHHCQGAHGSLLPEEMKIPFILFTPASS